MNEGDKAIGGIRASHGISPFGTLFATTSSMSSKIPYGRCHCGCGSLTNIAKKTVPRNGYIKGEPIRFVSGHQRRLSATKPHIPAEFRQCTKCQVIKSTSEFTRDHRRPCGTVSHCKACVRVRVRKNKQKYPYPSDRNRKSAYRCKLRTKFNLSLDEYQEMSKRQNGKCAICNNPESKKRKDGTPCALSVDHCHKSGRVRKLLCDACNRGIGLLNDNPELLLKAASYLIDYT